MQATLEPRFTLDPCAAILPADVWRPSERLTPRVRRLRDEFWSFYTREFRNEVAAYTTGSDWDVVYSIWSWTNVPEVALFQKGFRSYLRAAATKVDLPRGFWDEPLPVRQALFFRQVVSDHLPTRILNGELVVGSHFSTALSRCLNKREARERDRQEEAFLKEWRELNGHGVGNCAAVPGHLIPNYPKVLHMGWQSLYDEAQRVLNGPGSTQEQRVLARAMVICGDAVVRFGERYAAEAERLAAAEGDAARAAELREIARHLPKDAVAAAGDPPRGPAGPLDDPPAAHAHGPGKLPRST